MVCFKWINFSCRLEGTLLQTLRRRVRRFVCHRIPPRNQDGENEGRSEVSCFVSCCCVGSCKQELRVESETELFWQLEAEDRTSMSRSPGRDNCGVWYNWFEPVNRLNINFVTNLEAEELISTFQNFIGTSVQGRKGRNRVIFKNKYKISLSEGEILIEVLDPRKLCGEGGGWETGCG